ncbi:prepilin peptidase [Cohnella suwonensis]|uniref:Prepilin peptidase n=1 Tax=Cohnella suwonensis TaxID=696072 RepID=A0ABW0M0J0_9BACL
MVDWSLAGTGALLAAACWTDVRKLRIPNALTIAFATCGFASQWIFHGADGLALSAWGAAAGFLPLYAMNRFGGIGGGDVKWFGAYGTWAGPAATLKLLVLSIWIAGAFACLLLVLRLPVIRGRASKWKWPWGKHPAEGGRGVHFPFMLAVAPGFFILLGEG